MLRTIRKNRGFTLVELLIVVIILAILAAIVIPQFSSSSEDAKLSSLQSTLSSMRNAVELYYHQHGQRYPGQYAVNGSTTADATTGAISFVKQLTQYTDVDGQVSATKGGAFKFGPYLKSSDLPKNPFEPDATKAIAVEVDVGSGDISAPPTASGNTGWKFYAKIGRFIANDGRTLSDNTTKTVNQ